MVWLRADERWVVEEVKPLICVLLALCPQAGGASQARAPTSDGVSSQVIPKAGSLVISALWGAQLSPPSHCPQWNGEQVHDEL